jgi:chorismate mutase
MSTPTPDSAPRDEVMREIGDIRSELDEIDPAILELLGRRINLTVRIGQINEEHGHRFRDDRREVQLINRATKMAIESGLNPKFSVDLFQGIFHEAERILDAGPASPPETTTS